MSVNIDFKNIKFQILNRMFNWNFQWNILFIQNDQRNFLFIQNDKQNVPLELPVYSK